MEIKSFQIMIVFDHINTLCTLETFDKIMIINTKDVKLVKISLPSLVHLWY